MSVSLKTLTLTTAVTLGSLLSGCATIVTGSDQSIQVDSTPGNAVVTLNGTQHGTTPVKLNVQRNASEAKLQISLSGFEPKEIKLKKSTNGWVWGNILLGGIIGVAVDASTGAMYSFKLPEQGDRVEIPASGKTAPEGVDLWIDVVLQPKSQWSKIDQLTPAAIES